MQAGLHLKSNRNKLLYYQPPQFQIKHYCFSQIMVQFPTLLSFFHMLFNIGFRLPQSISSFHMFSSSFFYFLCPPPFFFNKKTCCEYASSTFYFFLLFFFTVLHLLLGFVITSTRHFLFFSIRPKYFCSKYSIYIQTKSVSFSSTSCFLTFSFFLFFSFLTCF